MDDNEARAVAKAMIIGSLIPLLMARTGDTDASVNHFEKILDTELDKLIAAERERSNAKEAARAGSDLAEMLSWLRGRGWTVGVHNDYRLPSGPMTFWLFTHGGRCLKGEGPSDEFAVAAVVDQAKTIQAEDQ